MWCGGRKATVAQRAERNLNGFLLLFINLLPPLSAACDCERQLVYEYKRQSNQTLFLMASLRRVAINVHRVLNSAPLLTPKIVAASTNPLLRPLLWYSSFFPFTSDSHSHTNNDPHSLHIDLSNEETKRRLFNRLLYRSKQRGFLELDLVLGKWVQDNLHSLDETRIKALIQVLDLENPDLWKWISGQELPPESISINPVFAAVRERVMKNVDSHSAPETRATPGQPWVRGWDDIKKGRDGPITGNQ